MKSARYAAAVGALCFLLGSKPIVAAPDQYDDSQSHPLRIAAYLIHPAAFLLEWTFFRPFHWLVSATAPQEAVFGHEPHPPILSEPQPTHNYGSPRKITANEVPANPEPATKQLAAQPPAEAVNVVEVPVEKKVVEEVPKPVEIERLVFPAVAFRFDSAELSEFGKGQVYLAAQRLREKPDLAVIIEGHLDNIGTQEYNQKLALRRAETVVAELSTQGIDSNRISAASSESAKPSIDQETYRARAGNRRVEFQVNAR